MRYVWMLSVLLLLPSNAFAQSGHLVSVRTDTDQLIRIEFDGTWQTIGNPGDVGLPAVSGLAFDASTQTLYAVDNSINFLAKVDLSSGAGFEFAALSRSYFGLAFDSDANRILAVESSYLLFGIDPVTFNEFLVSSGLASHYVNFSLTYVKNEFGPVDAVYYTESINPDRLHLLPLVGGVDAIISSLPGGSINGLTFHAGTGSLYAIQFASPPGRAELLEINRTTGVILTSTPLFPEISADVLKSLTHIGDGVQLGPFNKADLDHDGDVDIFDFTTFSICFNGALNPPACP